MLMKVQFMKYNFKLIKLGSVNLSYKLKYVLLSLLSLFLLMTCSKNNDKIEIDENEVNETKMTIKDVNKNSKKGKSTFFPDDRDTQDVVDAINEEYDNRTHINGNTFEGLTAEGIIVRMYLTEQKQI